MFDDPTRIRRRRLRTRALILGAVVLVLCGKSVFQAVTAGTGPLPAGYEFTPPPGQFAELRWDDLRAGNFDRRDKPRIAGPIAALNGKQAQVKGYLLPLHSGSASNEFFMSASPGGCYFCNPLGPAEVVMIQTHKGLKMEVTPRPVLAFGTLRAATGAPTDQALYVMEDSVLVIAN